MFCCGYDSRDTSIYETLRLRYNDSSESCDFDFLYNDLTVKNDMSEIKLLVEKNNQKHEITFSKKSFFTKPPSQSVILRYNSNPYYVDNLRIVYPNSMITKDYRLDRLNMYLTKDSKFTKYDLS